MHHSHRLSQLPPLVADWPSVLDDFPYQLSGEDLAPHVSIACHCQLLIWAPALSAEQLNQLSLTVQADGRQLVLQGARVMLGATTVLLSAECNEQELKALLEAQDWEFDWVVMSRLPNLHQPGLILMDMDSTTIQIECIDEIAALAGVGEEVSAVTAAAMRGELDFEQSLRARVGKLADAPEAILQQVADSMPLMPGLKDLLSFVKQIDWKVAIASGGFTYFAERLQQDLGFDRVVANQLEIIDGKLTGQVLGGVVDAQVKADTLKALAQEFGATQTMAIGDGANDLLMLAESDFGVAIHAKPLVQAKAQMAIRHSDLDGVVRILSASELLSGCA